MKHFASNYIGKKWVSGARGPDAFDCWGLLYWIYLNHYRIDVPCYPNVPAGMNDETKQAFDAALASDEWRRIEKPVDGCAVVMGNAVDSNHVGLYLDVDGGVVLHAKIGTGVLCQRVVTLQNHHLFIHGFYLPRQWPT